MTLVYLITEDDDLAGTVMSALPPQLGWLRFPSFASLPHHAGGDAPDLVLADLDAASAGRPYLRSAYPGSAPILALLRGPHERGPALSAGVDGYLPISGLKADGAAALIRCLKSTARSDDATRPVRSPVEPALESSPANGAREGDLHPARMAVIGRLAAGLLHEITNPLQAIRGSLTLAGEEASDPLATAGYLRIALQETERITALLERLRGFYRPTGEPPAAIDLGALARETLDLAHKELARGQLMPHLALEGGTARIEAQAGELRLALVSLIFALCDFLAPGSGDLTLSAGRGDGSAWLCFEARAARRPEGRPIDLALCQTIVAGQRGSIRLSREPGGVAITLQFPALAEASSPTPNERVCPPPAS